MKVVVIGGVAAGTKAAAKLKREDRSAEVILYTKSREISYAGCGLPYYVGGVIESDEALIVNTPEKFQTLTGVMVETESEATAVNAEKKTVLIQNLRDQSEKEVSYDKLVIAVGAKPVIPAVEGTALAGVFTMRTPEDAIAVRAYAEEKNCRRAVVVGGGFIGLEIAENLMAKGISVTVMDMADQIMPQVFDPEMADYMRRKLQEKGMRIMTGAALRAILGEEKATGVQTSGGRVDADLIVLAVGVKPATDFLDKSGLELEKAAVVVDEHMQTNLKDIYAVGDCAIVKNRMTGNMQWSAMGSTANITGRLLAKNMVGKDNAYTGCLGTAVVRLAEDMNAGRTGLTMQQAQKAGYEPVSVLCVVDDKAHYYPGAAPFVIKLIADAKSHKLLGIQVIGAGAVDKMVDIAVTGISMGAVVEDYDTMDFSYAPPFSTAIHPFVQACYILENKLNGELESFTPAEYAAGAAKGYRVLDIQQKANIFGATWIDLATVMGPVEGLAKEEKLLLVCNRGKRAYIIQNRLKAYGYTNTKVLEGGTFFNKVKVENPAEKLSPEEIKRVKGLGCLRDKRYPDVFNVRVITRNGKITSAEHRVIAEAADRFGSGSVAMTTRLTLEIQGVPYANLEDLFAFLKENNLETGGTGSLVRPVVSCKGTTCQYGLADTFDLSEKLHERFYVGYHGVTLPHKFKIAVGGCPNNCVKPDLNDLGIVGQRVPMIDLSKCRGCKKCQVEANCPIKVAHLEDGKICVDAKECNHCGRCMGKCPFGAFEESQYGYKVYIGGRWGKRVAHGHALDRIFTSDEEVMDVVEKAILFFRSEGITGERFADTIDRLGFEYVQDKLLNTQIDKSAVLNKTVKGGATC
ncbi:MAG: FAD-dependent oxidoreductase [Lachnospiraceae bacterium]|nr:FAD-dependent oxidoreductase [Lachnospiraceae bacterium]